jgi:hypothetical protein
VEKEPPSYAEDGRGPKAIPVTNARYGDAFRSETMVANPSMFRNTNNSALQRSSHLPSRAR